MTRRVISIPRPAPVRWSRTAVAASLLVHAVAIAAVARFHPPAEMAAPVRRLPAPEIVYLDFPSISPAGVRSGSLPAEPRTAGPSAAVPAAAGAGASAAPRAGSLPGPVAAAGSAGAVPAAGVPGSTSAALRPGFRDARLHVDPKALTPAPAPRPVHERLVSDARARILAEPDSIAAREARSLASRQVTIRGRKVTVFGDSAAAGFRTEEIELRPEVQTLSVDGRSWERLELSRQDDAFVRDSILRARTRATRERVDAARRSGRASP